MIAKRLTVLSVFLIILFSTNISTVKAEINLIKNGSFEKVHGTIAADWSTDLFHQANTVFKIETNDPHSGKYCFSIENKKPNDARIFQSIKIIPGKTYKIQFWYKTYNIDKYGPKLTLNYSGYDSVYDSDYLQDTKNKWKKYEIYIKTKKNTPGIINPWFRIGGFSNNNTGKVYFDDIVFSESSKIPDGSKVAECNDIKDSRSGSIREQADDKSQNSGNSYTTIFIIAGIIIVAGIMAAELFLTRNIKNEPVNTIEVKDEDEE